MMQMRVVSNGCPQSVFGVLHRKGRGIGVLFIY